MRTYTIRIFVSDGDSGNMRESQQKFQIRASTVDSARDEARNLVASKGHQIRSVSFGVADDILVYTWRSKPAAATVEGWRYKKPPNSKPKKDA